MLLDLHAHILPAVDDGAKTLGESIRLINALRAQGVQAIFATPHFYAETCVFDQYIKTIADAFSAICGALEQQGQPDLRLGYEVHYFKNMAATPEIRLLTLGGADSILIEFPYRDIDERMVEDIACVRYNFNIKPVIAHIDRYIPFHNFSALLDLIQAGDAYGQLNADAVLTGAGKRDAFRLLETGAIHYLGSDAHNMEHRPPHMQEALARIRKKCGQACVSKILSHSEALYHKTRPLPQGRSAEATVR